MKKHPPCVSMNTTARPLLAQEVVHAGTTPLDLLGSADLLSPKGDNSELRFKTIGLVRQSLERFQAAKSWHSAQVRQGLQNKEYLQDLVDEAASAFTSYQLTRIASDFLNGTDGLEGENATTIHALSVAGGTIYQLCHQQSPIAAKHFESSNFIQHFCGPYWAEQDRIHWSVLESVQDRLKERMQAVALQGGPEWTFDFLAVLEDLDTDQIAALVNCKGQITWDDNEDDPPLSELLHSYRSEWHEARDKLAEATSQLMGLSCGLWLGDEYSEPPGLQTLLKELSENHATPVGLPGVLAMLLEERSATHFNPKKQGAFQISYQHRARTAAAQHDFWQWWLLEHFRDISSSESCSNDTVQQPPPKPRSLKTLNPTLAELLEQALTHPKHLHAYEVPVHLRSLKESLHGLCFLWTGSRPSLEEAQLLTAIQTQSAQTIALAFGVFMHAIFSSKKQLLTNRSLLQRTQSFIKQRILPKLDELIEHYTVSADPAITTTAELHWNQQWQQLIDEDNAQASKAPATEVHLINAAQSQLTCQSNPPSTIDDKTVPQPFSTNQITLRFLTNPTSEVPKFHTPVQIRQGHTESFQQLADEVGLESDIPVQSIARAVFHYLWDTPPSIRACMNKLRFAGLVWHKIKRGKMRIYVHLNEDDVLFMSVIMRRDWDQIKLTG